jgi:cell division septum initiation protein DivIVA
LERRISKLTGETSNEETVELEARINELTKELQGKTNTHETLNAQIKKLQVSPVSISVSTQLN